MNDSPEYLEKRARYEQLLTVYGRKPVLEALRDPRLRVQKLHLASSNRSGGIIAEIEAEAQRLAVPVAYHDRAALARISKNGRQDQGVAADIELDSYRPLGALPDRFRVLALDGVTNPSNLGMIIRSVAASGIDGMLVARRGHARLDPQVIKASAGTLFQAPLYHCDNTVSALAELKAAGAYIVTLSSTADESLYAPLPTASRQIYVLGNETDGIGTAVADLADESRSIPLHNGVESLNVAVTAALVAFRLRQ